MLHYMSDTLTINGHDTTNVLTLRWIEDGNTLGIKTASNRIDDYGLRSLIGLKRSRRSSGEHPVVLCLPKNKSKDCLWLYASDFGQPISLLSNMTVFNYKKNYNFIKERDSWYIIVLQT